MMSDLSQWHNPVAHGGLDFGELERFRLLSHEVLDFSANTHPYGPSPDVRKAIAGVALDRYPDRDCLQLCRTLLEYEVPTNTSQDSIVCGNGTAELIWAIARAVLQPGCKAALIHPTFGEYRAASLSVGASVVTLPTQASRGFQVDMEEVVGWINRERPTLLWLCNPNNPTGLWLDHRNVIHLAERCQKTGTVLVVDEAYWRFVIPPDMKSALDLVIAPEGFPLIVLRSLTKDFALAGLRLGYAVASPEMAQRLKAQLPSWNVSSVAQAAGFAAIADRRHLQQTMDALRNDRESFFHALRSTELKVVPSSTHFCLLEVGNARKVREQLLCRKILVRDCTSFDLPEFIRVVTRPSKDWQQLLIALSDVLGTKANGS